MSFDLSLQCKECSNSLKLEEPHTGGTMPMGGYYTTDFNITYNYTKHYYKHLDKKDGLCWLHGKTGIKTIQKLEHAIKELGTKQDKNYWKNTQGNAGAALVPLLESAKQYPKAIWEVSS